MSSASSSVIGTRPTLNAVNLWKILGIAGMVGVAAGGVVLARAERRRRAYTPEEIRDRLHARAAEAAASS
jgi:hypothetical protein